MTERESAETLDDRTLLRLDLGLTFATEFVILGCSLGVLKLASAQWGAIGFGEFVIARRAMGWIQLPVLVGLHLALARFVAMARANGQASEEASLIRSAALISAVAIAIMATAMLIVPRATAYVLLGSANALSTLRALVLSIAGLVLHTVAYGALRGRRSTSAANAVQWVALGIVPVGTIVWPGITVVRYLTVTGLAMIALSAAVIVSLLMNVRAIKSTPADLRSARSTLLTYGAPRIPGEVALGALFALPVMIAAHRWGAIVAGQIGLAMSFLQLLGALFSPLGQAMLPTLSARVAEGDVRSVRKIVQWTAVAGIALAALGVAALEVVTPFILSRFFGNQFVSATMIVRVVLLAGVPYGAYVLLRCVLDAVHCQPLNARNLLVALTAFGVVALLTTSPQGMAAGVAVAMFVLGVRTLHDVVASLTVVAFVRGTRNAEQRVLTSAGEAV